jgi:tripartite-type tricarboxylate transporter receptor subunit TctC
MSVRRTVGGLSLASFGLTAFAAGSLWTAAPAQAQSVEQFYKGKQMRFIIRSAVGGGYDLYSRLLTRHITKHIPGSPQMLAVNMPGGGGIIAANYVAEVAPKDGTILTMVGLALPMDQALGLNPSLKADMRTFNWIGNLSNSNQLTYVWHTSATKTLADAKRRETTIGATGSGDISIWLPEIYNSILGTKFKIIFGYPGVADVRLAMERGEVEGVASNPWASTLSTQSHYIDNKQVRFLIQAGLAKEKALPDVPLLRELATNAKDQEVLDYVSKVVAIGRPVATTPGVPVDRVRALRMAFDATLVDADFISEAEKLKAEIVPMSGAELQAIVEEVANATPDLAARVRVAMQPKSAHEIKR